jgi:hypothetical protein
MLAGDKATRQQGNKATRQQGGWGSLAELRRTFPAADPVKVASGGRVIHDFNVVRAV